MGFGIYSAVSGANAREKELEIIANNIANVQTAGFKEIQVSFSSELDRGLAPVGRNEMVPSLVRDVRSRVVLTPGAIHETGNPLDMAIQGDGFFEVQTPDGFRYTRNGGFTVDREGTLVTPQGFPVMTTSGAVTLPRDGRLTVSSSGQMNAGDRFLGALRVIHPTSPDDIAPEGLNLYAFNGPTQPSNPADAAPAQTAATTVAPGVGGRPAATPKYRIVQGHLEGANVDLVRNLTRLIEVSRAYEAHQKSLAKMMESSQQLNQMARVT